MYRNDRAEGEPFPLKYLGVPITASRLIKCMDLVNKILAKVHLWDTRSISFANRANLIRSVVFGMLNYWASIFLMTNKVLPNITKIYRNYLWSGKEELHKIPYISWQHTCLPKAQGWLGLKDFQAWNKAIIAKLVWAITHKKDILWVGWVHGRYIKGKSWWEYIPAHYYRWHWRKIYYMK